MDDLTDGELRKQAKNFLRDFKELLGEGGLIVSNRVKNQKGLVTLDITEIQREHEIYSLTLENYCSGPIKDEYKPGYYWIFGKNVNDIEVYIKLKLRERKQSEFPECMSFHPSEFPVTYPFSED